MAQPQLLSDADVWGSPGQPAAPPAAAPATTFPTGATPLSGGDYIADMSGGGNLPPGTVRLQPGQDAPPPGTPYLTPGGVLWGNQKDGQAAQPAPGGDLLTDADVWGKDASPPASPDPQTLGGYWDREWQNGPVKAWDQVKSDIGVGGEGRNDIGDILSLGLSPFTAAFHGAVTRPTADLMDKADKAEGITTRVPTLGEIAGRGQQGQPLSHWFDPVTTTPAQRHDTNEGNVGLTLSALGAPAIEADPAAAGTIFSGIGRAVSRTIDPIAAGFSKGARETQAANVIAGAAHDLPAVRAAVASPPAPIVDGSAPTTFQATGDMGLGAMEKGVRQQSAKATEAFADRAAQQNAARSNALQGIQSDADPQNVSQFLRDRFAATDQATDAAVQAATEKAHAASSAAGGNLDPTGNGAAIRAAVSDAESAARAHEGQLWQRVDPDGTLTGNTQATTQAAKDIQGSMSPAEKPLAGETKDVFDYAANLGPTTPLRDLIALRSRVSSQMRVEAGMGGDPRARSLLTQLRGAIQDNLAGTIADKVSSDQAAVQAGQMAPEDAMASRLQADQQQFYEQRATQARAATGTAPSGYAAGGPRAIPGVDGAAQPASGRPGNAPGNPGIPEAGAIQPTADAGAVDRLNAATGATKARAQTFGAVQNVTKISPVTGQPVLPDGSVPSQFFSSASAAPQRIANLLQAAPGARGALEDYAAGNLKAAAGNTDGTVDPKRFAAWQKKYAGALSALPPETQARFADAASAGQAMQDAMAARSAALKTQQEGAAGRLLNLTDPGEVVKTVGATLSSPTGPTQMGHLVDAVKGDPDALAGLRRAVVEHLMNKALGPEAGTTGIPGIKGATFQTYVRSNRAAMAKVFNPDELNTLGNIAADIARSQRSDNALKFGESQTAGNLAAAGHGGVGAHVGDSMFSTAIALAAEHAGGSKAMFAAVIGRSVLGALKSAGISGRDDLVMQALLHPEVANRLLQRIPTDAQLSQKAVNARMRGVVTAILAANGQRSDDRMPSDRIVIPQR